MELTSLVSNLTNPALLFFVLGIISVQIKSDLKIPDNSAKFISIYLLLSIGFKGGQELSHSNLNLEIAFGILLGLFLAILFPLYAFFILKRKFSTANAGAIAAAYGSVSTVTFITTISFLEMYNAPFSGHMIAVMAIMEAPAIVVGALLIRRYTTEGDTGQSILQSVIHTFTNGSVLLIFGSLIIGFLASEKQAQGIAPFTTDIFKGFLAVFLLDMGITCGKQLSVLTKKGVYPFVFSAVVPFINGTISLFLSMLVTDSAGDQLLFALLGASASYIAVPAAMKSIAPQANPSLFLPMALGITFPINIIFGIPLYYSIIQAMS